MKDVEDVLSATRLTDPAVLVIVYSLVDRRSCNAVTTKWLALLKKLNIHLPIVIAANKQDLDKRQEEEAKGEWSQFLDLSSVSPLPRIS